MCVHALMNQPASQPASQLVSQSAIGRTLISLFCRRKKKETKRTFRISRDHAPPRQSLLLLLVFFVREKERQRGEREEKSAEWIKNQMELAAREQCARAINSMYIFKLSRQNQLYSDIPIVRQ